MKKNGAAMNRSIARWLPRVLGIGFAAFLAIFALDVFDQGLGFGATIVALAIHMIPTWLVLAAVGVAWRHEKAGAAMFFMLAAVYLFMVGSRFPMFSILLIAGPPVVIGVLFLLSGQITRKSVIKG